jgi:hypothetical protein
MESNRGQRGIWATAMVSLVVSTIVTVSGVMVYDKHYATKVYSFDLAAYSQDLAENVAMNKLTMEQANEALDKVNAILQGYGSRKGSVILFTGAVRGDGVEKINP